MVYYYVIVCLQTSTIVIIPVEADLQTAAASDDARVGPGPAGLAKARARGPSLVAEPSPEGPGYAILGTPDLKTIR